MKIKLNMASPGIETEVELKENGHIGRIIDKKIEDDNIVYIIEGKEDKIYFENDFVVLDYGLYEIKYFLTDTDEVIFFTKEETENLLLKLEDAESLLFEDGFEKVSNGLYNFSESDFIGEFTYYINAEGQLATLLFKKVKWR